MTFSVFAGKGWQIRVGDIREIARELDRESFDACLGDAPYGLEFMGRAWDKEVPGVDIWEAILGLLKPGAPMMMFGGTRTFHRMAVNIEDAGFEIRDCLSWLYGSGFPKSLDIGKSLDKEIGATPEVIGSRVLTGNAAISLKEKGGTYGIAVGSAPGKEVPITTPTSVLGKRWAGYGTALKPAWEPCVVARKPIDGTVVDNVWDHGVGGLNIVGTRIDFASTQDADESKRKNQHGDFESGTRGNRIFGADDSQRANYEAPGRWPANLALDETAAALLDEQSGDVRSMSSGGSHRDGYEGGMLGGIDCVHTRRGDEGGASRFFYVAKANRFERDFGCEHLPLRSAGEATEREEDSAGTKSPRAGAGRTSGARNYHPTVKPIALMKWLATMVLPPARPNRPRRLLVPFSGSGSEMIAALRAGWDEVVGVELLGEYAVIAEARLTRWAEVAAHLEPAGLERAVEADARQVDLFGNLSDQTMKEHQ